MPDQARPKSPFIYDKMLPVDLKRVLLVVYFQSNTEIAVWMPKHVSDNMSETFPADVVAAVKDFVETVPRGGGQHGRTV